MIAAFILMALQAEPAPVAPDPGHPIDPPPPGLVPLPARAPDEGPPENAFVLGAGAAYRRAPADLDPRWGMTIGLSLERRLATLGAHLELGLGLDIGFHRFAKSVQGSAATEQGMEIPFDGVQTISQTSFAAAPSIAVRLGRVRPYFAAGGGLSLGYFTSDDKNLRPGSQDALDSFVRAIAGVGVEVSDGTWIVARAAYTRLLFPPTLALADGRALHVFGDLLDFGAAVRFEF